MRGSEIILAKTLWIIIVLSTLTVFSGCATPRLTKQARVGINSVSINPEVSMPDKMGYVSYEMMSGTAFGLAGALITMGSGKDEQEKLNAIMRENDIDVGRIVVEEFREQLAAKQVFRSIVTSAGDANFSLKINDYRLAYKPFADGDHLGAGLKVTVYLKRANGDLVWKATAFCSAKRTDA